MKLSLVTFFSLLSTSSAFQISQPWQRGSASLVIRRSTVEEAPSDVDVDESSAKMDLLETAKSLNREYGCILIDSAAQDRLRESVEKLEGLSDAPTVSSDLLGDWDLLCSTASASLENGPLDKIGGIDTSKLPFFNEGPIKEIRDTLKKSWTVKQLVKAEENSGVVNRIDHVLQYMPPDTLSEFLDSLPDALKSLNINPLQVSESKVVLIHNAEIESMDPVLKTKLSLASVVVNVAGKSDILEPEGADVLGINVPFGDLLNAGSFETTYMDGDLRISRSKVGIVDQLRVFVRAESEEVQELTELDEEIPDAEIVDVEATETEEGVEDEESDAGEGSDGFDVSPSDY